MKTFNLVDVNNKILAQGVEFDDGRICCMWLGSHRSIVIWNSITELSAVSLINDRKLVYLN